METRPDIETLASGDALRRWYWRKDELVAYARRLNLRSSGGKFDVLDRIAHFLDTGETDVPSRRQNKPTSKFDWHKAPLTRATMITDSYKNSQNVRRFFKSECDPNFKFNIAFMEWMKGNVGKTLDDACAAYLDLKAKAAQPGHKTQIKPYNQFNQYTRDFFADNPNMTMEDVRRIWALKIERPSENGRHVYDPADLTLDQS